MKDASLWLLASLAITAASSCSSVPTSASATQSAANAANTDSGSNNLVGSWNYCKGMKVDFSFQNDGTFKLAQALSPDFNCNQIPNTLSTTYSGTYRVGNALPNGNTALDLIFDANSGNFTAYTSFQIANNQLSVAKWCDTSDGGPYDGCPTDSGTTDQNRATAFDAEHVYTHAQ